MRQLLVLGLEDDPARGRPVGRAELDQGVALLAPALGLLAAGVVAQSPRDCGDPLDRGVDALLEAAALAGAGRLGLGDALRRASSCLSSSTTSRVRALEPLRGCLASLGLLATRLELADRRARSLP